MYCRSVSKTVIKLHDIISKEHCYLHLHLWVCLQTTPHACATRERYVDSVVTRHWNRNVIHRKSVGESEQKCNA